MEPENRQSKIFTPGPISDEISRLNKEATALKEKGDLDGAVACLVRATALMAEHYPDNYPIASWLRLPVFMQQAGMFEESMEFFDLLLKDIKEKRIYDGRPIASQYFIAVNYKAIYDKMRLVCQRQGFPQKAHEYRELKQYYSDKMWSMSEAYDDERRRYQEERRKEINEERARLGIPPLID